MRSQDSIGMGLSGLCLIHCLALPILISLAPVLAWAEGEWVHLGLAVLALVVGVSAMRDWTGGLGGLLLRVQASIGIALLFFGGLAELSERVEQGVTVLGATLLALAHAWAWGTKRDWGTKRA